MTPKPNDGITEAVRRLLQPGLNLDFLETSMPQQPWLRDILPASPSEGARFGAYRIVRELGRGGMSVVYLAARADDAYEKQVAIKVIDRAYCGGDIQVRLQRERQALASLEHPNIAHLYDAGVSEDGLAYLVMERIEGKRIDEYCREHQLGTSERLRCFLQVCDAVALAHRNLVVHRDLKPSNILVTDAGVPKLIDFGISKISSEQSSEDATQSFSRLTPEYASPEQLLGENVNTVSDVYSLGVVLFEVMTGERPYEFASRNPWEIAQCVIGQEPRRAGTIRHELRGDLEAILLWALEKDPGRRYASVIDFAADIERFLGSRPVLAAPDSIWYRARKFLRRRFLAVTSVSLLTLSVLTGTWFTFFYARRSERQAAESIALASQVRRYYRDIETLPGSLPVARQMVEKSVRDLRRLRMTSDPHDIARNTLPPGLFDLGAILGHPKRLNLGDTAGSLRCFEEAHQYVLGADDIDGRRDENLNHARSYAQRLLGELLLETGERTRAITHLQAALRIDSSVQLNRESDPVGRLYSRAISEYMMARVLAEDGQAEESRRLQRSALAILRERARKLSSEGAQTNLASGLFQCGLAERSLGAPKEALPLFQESLAIWTVYANKAPPDMHALFMAAKAHCELGATQSRLGAIRESRRQLETAIAGFREIRKLEPSAASNERYLAAGLTELGGVLLHLRENEAAGRASVEALELTREATKRDPANVNAKAEFQAAIALAERLKAAQR